MAASLLPTVCKWAWKKTWCGRWTYHILFGRVLQSLDHVQFVPPPHAFYFLRFDISIFLKHISQPRVCYVCECMFDLKGCLFDFWVVEWESSWVFTSYASLMRSLMSTRWAALSLWPTGACWTVAGRGLSLLVTLSKNLPTPTNSTEKLCKTIDKRYCLNQSKTVTTKHITDELNTTILQFNRG